MKIAIAILVIEVLGTALALALIGFKLFGTGIQKRKINKFLERHWPRWLHS